MQKLLGLFLILLTSCSQGSSCGLEKSPLLQDIFNSAEIADLCRILTFYEESVEAFTGLDDPAQAQDLYLNSMLVDSNSGTLDLRLDYEKQQQLMATIDSNLFLQIWCLLDSYSRPPVDTSIYINLYPEGKYAEFLARYAEESEATERYWDILNNHYDFMSPSAYAGVIENGFGFDLNDPVDRLVLAIQILTWNDYFMRPYASGE